MKVLVVGAAGRVGCVLTRTLANAHELVLADVVPLDDPRFVPCDIGDLARLREVTAGCQAVVHLAIADSSTTEAEGVPRYAEQCVRVHVLGTHNVLRAAVDVGAERVLYASSVSAVEGYPRTELIGSGHRHLGGGIYGITKGFGEELCRMFHDSYGLSALVLRLGNVYFPQLSAHGNDRPHPSRVHVDDVARAFALALAAPPPAFALVHIVGDNPGRHWDLTAAWQLCGWRPTVRFGEDGKPVDGQVGSHPQSSVGHCH